MTLGLWQRGHGATFPQNTLVGNKSCSTKIQRHSWNGWTRAASGLSLSNLAGWPPLSIVGARRDNGDCSLPQRCVCVGAPIPQGGFGSVDTPFNANERSRMHSPINSSTESAGNLRPRGLPVGREKKTTRTVAPLIATFMKYLKPLLQAIS